MAKIVAIVPDLMLGSRVSTALEGAGHEVERAQAPPGDLAGVELVVADLDAIEPESLAELGPPVLGFYPHTDVEIKERADRVGMALAVPRSRMVRELPELVARLLGGA